MDNSIRYFLFLRYKGTQYHGWQIQPNATSVQEIVNTRLSVLLQETIETTGAGRTDTGVHAEEFVAHFNSLKSIPDSDPHFIYKLNCLLPYDISVFDIKRVNANAHARFDALSRTYQYKITQIKDPFLTEYAYCFGHNLAIDSMNQAATLLFKYTDFTSFSKLHTDVKTNNCVITEAEWKKDGTMLIFTISADRFLRNMVRAIVGTLLDVGSGKLGILQFEEIIQLKNRNSAGRSVPANGLFLTKIRYPAELFSYYA